MTRFAILVLAASAAICHDALAFEYRARFVRRIGDVDYPIDQQLNLEAVNGHWPRARLRMQFGVFDDADGPAPVGGFVGWNFGTIDIGFGFAGERTPGRLAPFTFGGPISGGIPLADPFTSLTFVEPVIGQQTILWPAGSDPEGPVPQPVARGRNEWVSIYEFTLIPPQQSYADCMITIAGNLIAAREWRSIGDPTPPTEEKDGFVFYVPLIETPFPFERRIRVLNDPTPAPHAGSAMVLCLLVGTCRRRR